MPAGAIVADAVLDLMSIDQLEICPWALREGVILKRLDMLADPATRALTPPSDTATPV
jgi:exopolyphosphatase/guanosine-5'-triphosphate,3'-diphosphate pyrophosphatase